MGNQGNETGRRIRELRTRLGLSQEQVGGGVVTPGYVSLIESGGRKPSSKALAQIADALGVTADYLVSGVDAAAAELADLEIRDLELELVAGSGDVLERIETLGRSELTALQGEQVQVLRARALELRGDLSGAIEVLESLGRAQSSSAPVSWLRNALALSRCYREIGDLSRAIDVGEKALDRVRGFDIAGSDAEIELLSTTAFAYIERGDIAHARYLLEGGLAVANERGSRRARGATLWNLSHVAKESGDFSLAREMADRALGLFAEESDTRNLARLRNHLAVVLFESNDTDLDRVQELLVGARADLASAGSATDVAYCDTELARVSIARGDAGRAIEHARSALQSVDQSSLESARALMASARAWRVLGDEDAGLDAMRLATESLESMGARRQAAKGWVELASLYEERGQLKEALEFHRRAARIVGLESSLVSSGGQ